MNTDLRDTIKEKLYECDKHVEKLETAKSYLKALYPFTIKNYLNADAVESSFIDQLVFRFSKLQDTLGERIFPSLLILTAEDVKRKTFIDILNRLEELELIDKLQWLRLRETRNEIAHEYSENTGDVVNSINDVYDKSRQTIEIYSRIKNYIQRLL